MSPACVTPRDLQQFRDLVLRPQVDHRERSPQPPAPKRQHETPRRRPEDRIDRRSRHVCQVRVVAQRTEQLRGAVDPSHLARDHVYRHLVQMFRQVPRRRRNLPRLLVAVRDVRLHHLHERSLRPPERLPDDRALPRVGHHQPPPVLLVKLRRRLQREVQALPHHAHRHRPFQGQPLPHCTARVVVSTWTMLFRSSSVTFMWTPPAACVETGPPRLLSIDYVNQKPRPRNISPGHPGSTTPAQFGAARTSRGPPAPPSVARSSRSARPPRRAGSATPSRYPPTSRCPR